MLGYGKLFNGDVDLFFGDDGAFKVVGVGFKAQLQPAVVNLVVCHELVTVFGVFSQDNDQQTGGGGVKGAAVSHFGDVVAVSQKVDHIKTCPACGLVDGNDSGTGKNGQVVTFGVVTHNQKIPCEIKKVQVVPLCPLTFRGGGQEREQKFPPPGRKDRAAPPPANQELPGRERREILQGS